LRRATRRSSSARASWRDSTCSRHSIA
jgi:hypothetical protein